MGLPQIMSSVATFLTGRRNSTYWLNDRSPLKYGHVSPEMALRSTAYSNCLIRLSDQIASLDWSAEDPKVNKLLSKPNSFHSKYDFFFTMTFDLLLHGVSYLHHVGSGSVLEYIATFQPEEVREGIENNRPIYYITPRDGSSVLAPNGAVDADNIIRIFDVPTSFGPGSSRRELCSDSLRVILEVQDLVRDVAVNGPVLGAVVTMQGRSTDPAWAEKTVDTLDNVFSKGTGRTEGERSRVRRGGSMALDQGATLSVIGPALKLDAETVKYVAMEEIKVAAAHGVPAFMAGIVSDADSKYSNQAQQQASFYRDSVFPITEKLKISLSDALGTEVKPDFTRFWAGDLPEAIRMSGEAYASGVWKRSEARKITDQEVSKEDEIYVENPKSPKRDDEGLDVNRPRRGENALEEE